MIRFIPVLAILLFGLSACDRPEPVTYTIPKEERRQPSPEDAMGAATQAPRPDSSKMQVLPGMQEAAQSAPELSYTVPEGWEEFPPESVRKANFRSKEGDALIAVTVFPGDVGGLLANINRWRQQIGLDAITESEIDRVANPITISDHSGTLVNLQGPNASVLGGILTFHGDTWFFKMDGSTGTVAAQANAMEEFLASVQIEDQHHQHDQHQHQPPQQQQGY